MIASMILSNYNRSKYFPYHLSLPLEINTIDSKKVERDDFSENFLVSQTERLFMNVLDENLLGNDNNSALEFSNSYSNTFHHRTIEYIDRQPKFYIEVS